MPHRHLAHALFRLIEMLYQHRVYRTIEMGDIPKYRDVMNDISHAARVFYALSQMSALHIFGRLHVFFVEQTVKKRTCSSRLLVCGWHLKCFDEFA